MVSAWILFVKDYAKRHNITYSCALSTPLCSQEYQQKKGKVSPRLSAYSDLQAMVSKAQQMPKKLKSLPPLISTREDELYTTKIVKLKDILKGYNISFSKMKKDDMVKAILSHENIKEGVRMGDHGYIYADLKKAYGCLTNDAGGLRQALFALKQSKERIEAGKGKMKRDEYNLLDDNIKRYEQRIKECESLINRDYLNEYAVAKADEKARSKRFAEENK
jgi:flagellar capping protein FliD